MLIWSTYYSVGPSTSTCMVYVLMLSIVV